MPPKHQNSNELLLTHTESVLFLEMCSRKYVLDLEMANAALKDGPFLQNWGSQSVLTSVRRDAERLHGANVGGQQVQQHPLQADGPRLGSWSSPGPRGSASSGCGCRLTKPRGGRPLSLLPRSPRTGVTPSLAVTSPSRDSEAPLPPQR